MSNAPPRPLLDRLAGPCLALLAWLVGCFYFRGDLGKYLDDYAFVLRDPVTHEPLPLRRTTGHPWQDYHYFWRPIHLAMMYVVNTLFWENDAMIHAIVAGWHALAAFMLWKLLRELRPNDRAAHVFALGAAVLFMVLPWNYQVMIWPSTASAAIATAILLHACILALRHARWEGGWATRRFLIVLPILSFIAACFYEQPAAAFCAVPVVWLSASQRTGSFSKRLVRALGLGVLVGVPLVAYAVLLRFTAPPFARGGGGGLAPAQLVDRLGDTGSAFADALAGGRTLRLLGGSWRQGLEALHTPLGVVMALLLALAGVVWALSGRPMRASFERTPGDVPPPWAVAIALAMLAGAMAPVALIEDQGVQHRLLYVPLAAGVVALWAVLVGVTNACGRGSPKAVGALGVLVRGLFASGVVAGCVCLVGFQSLYHQRWRLDQRQLGELRAIASNEHADIPADVVLVPLKLRDRAAGTGVPVFDGWLRSVFETGWTARYATRFALRMPESAGVASAHIQPGGRLPLGAWSQTSVRYRPTPTIYERLLADREGWTVGASDDDAPAGVEIPYERMLPFITTRGGDVVLVRTLTVSRHARGTREPVIRVIDFPLVEALAHDAKVKTTTFRLDD